MYQNYIDSVSNSLQYETGSLVIGEDLARIQVPSGFKYLNGESAEMVLTDLWGNPPSDPGYESLGMLFGEDDTPFSDSSYVINITYTEEGYVEDEDAEDIDYDDLLVSMIEDTDAANEYRLENGYDEIELIGWASPPYYDNINKKLHWAKELRFGDLEQYTLNYNIRVLGRRGYLQLNVIGEMHVLGEVQDNIDEILPSVEFLEGNRYVDFDPNVDKVAAYGIAGLIGGKLAMKAGLFAKLGLIFAKFWKVIAIAVIAFGAGIKRFFSGRKHEEHRG